MLSRASSEPRPPPKAEIESLGGHPVLAALIEYLDRQVADEPEDPDTIRAKAAAAAVAGAGAAAPVDTPPDRLSVPTLGKTDSF